MSRTARTILLIVGGVAVILGGVWIGQGLNLIPGSFMTGSQTWLAIGLIVAAVGVGMLATALRRRQPPR